MNTTLSSNQLAFYRENGFVSHRNLLSTEEVTELRSAVLETVEDMKRLLGKKIAADVDPELMQDSDPYYEKVFTQRVNLWRLNSTVRHYMLNPDLGRMLCRIEGVEGLRVWHDQALIKEPYGNPTAWHIDNPYWSFHSHHAVSIWVALEDATHANGCLWFVPGSHKLATFTTSDIGSDLDALFDVYPQMAQIDPVGVPLQAGDCSFHNGLTAHGAGANMTRARRIAMTCAYMPAGSRFNGTRNVLPEPYFASLRQGDVLENDDWNPLV
jgi:phytanoyl-CoA hydroxylase